MSKLETNTIDTVSGTSTLQVGSTNTSTITLGVSGDTVNVPSGVTIANSGTATGFGGDNTPAFLGKPVTAATGSDDTFTKVSFTEAYDSDNKFDGSKFTPGTAGHYQVNVDLELSSSGGNGYGYHIIIYKKWSADYFLNSRLDGDAFLSQSRGGPSGVIYLDADDYIEVYASFNTPSGGNFSIGTEGQFSAYRILGT